MNSQRLFCSEKNWREMFSLKISGNKMKFNLMTILSLTNFKKCCIFYNKIVINNNNVIILLFFRPMLDAGMKLLTVRQLGLQRTLEKEKSKVDNLSTLC